MNLQNVQDVTQAPRASLTNPNQGWLCRFQVTLRYTESQACAVIVGVMITAAPPLPGDAGNRAS